ncbi:hypothetical protein [Bilophila wadsworthia]|uniref:hypothetical protein n=1 Tax=Bilophila wadsworthia TaxID=35833 RepID=UPI003AB5748F
MNKWCFLLIAACLLAPDTGHAALKARDDVKAEDAFNPNPAPDDLILPMPVFLRQEQPPCWTGNKRVSCSMCKNSASTTAKASVRWCS